MAHTKKTLTFALMDPPYRSARTATALRLIDIAARRGYDINVFAFEGAFGLPSAEEPEPERERRGGHAASEPPSTPAECVAAIQREAERHGGKLDWIHCERAGGEQSSTAHPSSVRSGTPADLWSIAQTSDGFLAIPAR